MTCPTCATCTTCFTGTTTATSDEFGMTMQIIKQIEVLRFDSENYICKRIFARAPDGTKIPMSLVCLKTCLEGAEKPKKTKPLIMYGYGSYGKAIDPSFRRTIIPYLDRGIIYVLAHVRGGGEMGREWYEKQGKYLTKRNTFGDFIACAEYLVDSGWTSKDLLACVGRSAGGLLVGNAINMRPDLFKIAVATVPFVDLMNTMCDPSIPLTTNEWGEWGNPNTDKYFDYMLSYSPYNNVRKQPYPHVFVSAGLHDPRVGYWEAAKWVAKLRFNKIGDSEILLKTNMDAGHLSVNDRYAFLKERSYEQAFVLDKLGIYMKHIKPCPS